MRGQRMRPVRILWVAEIDGERAYGYWIDQDDATPDADLVVVSLDTEGQFDTLPGRNLTEALCADLADFEDDQFIELATQARALAAETGTGLAAALIVGDALDSLPEPETEGPTAFHHSRYAALLQEE